ncbi:hypothetical protein M0R45_034518 [Rubus argutus]|uniref:Homeobox domain-containing protein n=1 Tax=Rubus argutus TaxID=59490 RepID=A0AAW1VR71_RUBAR
MVKHVNSLDELLSSGPSESQIFEGLEEIIPSSVLYSLVASTPIVPEPQPEPQPQLPIQVAELPALPEALPEGAGPSQRKPAKNKRYSHVQIRALEDFIAAHPTPTYDQKFLLSQQIGLPMKKVNKWITKHKAPVIQSDEQLIAELISRNEELVKEIEELKAQNQILINALQAGNCPQCGGPVPPPGVQQQPRVDVNPLNRRFLKSHQNPSIKNSFGGMHWNPCHLEINRDLLMTLLESLPKKYPASSEEPRTNFFSWLLRHGHNAQILEILSPGEEESYKERTQVMSAEFVLPTPKFQLVKPSSSRPSTRSICRKRPSGCLIRDLQNGSSFVTWVENVDVRDKTEALHPKLTPFVESGCLQLHIPQLVVIKQNQREEHGGQDQQEGVILANPLDCTELQVAHRALSSHNESSTISEIYRTDLSGNVYPPTALCMSLQPSVGPDPEIASRFGDKQTQRHPPSPGVFHDETGSFVIFAPIEKADFQSLLCGVDQEIQLMPFGFYILPNVSGSILDGTLLTMVFQITVKNVSKKKAVEVATQIVKETLHKIIEAVN